MTTYTQEYLLNLLADVITNHRPLEDVKVILNTGVAVNCAVRKELRPLHYAAYENSADCINLLIEYGANPNINDEVGYTPLHLAAKHGHKQAIEALVAGGAVVDFSDENQSDSLTDLSRALASLTIAPLNLAIENNQTECVKLLLNLGANPNTQYFLGCELNLVPLENVKCLELLLQYGANPDTFSRGGLSVLMKACKLQRPDVVKLLLHYGADVNIQCPPRFEEKTALHFAAMSGNTEITRMLLDAGASMKKNEQFKYTPMDFALTQDKVHVCELLLDYGADPNEVNGDDCSPLQVVSSTPGLKHQHYMIELLLLSGALPNFSSKHFSYGSPSLSPLIEYFTYQDEYFFDTVQMFLRYGACINITQPMKLYKIKDPCGILGQFRKLYGADDIQVLVIEAAEKFDAEAIYAESTLSAMQKHILLEEASHPRSLKQLCRIASRGHLHLPIPKSVAQLPLPSVLQRYLLYDI